MERTSAARNRLNATARRSAAIRAGLAVGGAQRQQDFQLGATQNSPTAHILC
jgi:hypothetical protein